METSKVIVTDTNKIMHIDEFLSPIHKLILLKYINMNNELISMPENFPKMVNQLAKELNRISGEISPTDWIVIMKNWIQNTRLKINELKNKKNYSCSMQDFELMMLIDSDHSLIQNPSDTEISCILDHLEVAHNSPKLWTTIGLEMEALGATNSKEEFWKKSFERWSNRVKWKKSFLDQLQKHNIDKSSFFNAIENRYLELAAIIDGKKCEPEEITCRICLQKNFNAFKDIHTSFSDDMTIAQTINLCSAVNEIRKEDGFPQHICESCWQLLENALKFKNLCEQSDYKLRNVCQSSESIKNPDCLEYVVEEDCFELNESEEEEEQGNNVSIAENETIDVDPEISSDQEEDISTETVPDVVVFTYDVTEETQMDSIEISRNEISENLDEKNQLSRKSKEKSQSVHQCEACGIICIDKSSLKKHIQSHAAVRPHQCNVCGKDFKTKISLKIHLRCHTGERPYVCEVCGRAFVQLSTLSYHRQIHTGEKNYPCLMCSYRARNINDLRIHTRTHTGDRPYECDQCPLKFTTSSNLQKHLRRHTGIKDFQCGSCGRSFFSRESARKHMVIHTGLKPYTCSECPLAYGWYNGLQKHMKTQHPGVKMPTEKYFADLMDNTTHV